MYIKAMEKIEKIQLKAIEKARKEAEKEERRMKKIKNAEDMRIERESVNKYNMLLRKQLAEEAKDSLLRKK